MAPHGPERGNAFRVIKRFSKQPMSKGACLRQWSPESPRMFPKPE